MRYAATPPYEVLQTAAMSFVEIQRMKRFARYWDIVANSGNWPHTLSLLLAGESAFASFLAFSDAVHTTARATHGIAMHKVASLLFDWLVTSRGIDRDTVGTALAADYARGRRHDWPELLRPWAKPRQAHRKDDEAQAAANEEAGSRTAARQRRHLAE
jgi:hypothetical protein